MKVDEGTQTYSPIGLRLLDELTHDAPLGNTSTFLDILDASGSWRETELKAVRTVSAVIAYPGLERHADAIGLLPRRYRVRISADLYVPLYRRNSDGIEFDAHPYDNTHPPSVIVRFAEDTFLTPAPNYPFPDHFPVLRGVVVDSHGTPVPYAMVTQGLSERVLSDIRGIFALPLRWVDKIVPIPIDAVDDRTGRLGSIDVQLPDALGGSQTIRIS
jgi:hypothetical protein